MLLTLRGLPPDIEIPEIRSYIQERCVVGRFLLDELAADAEGTWRVTVATMSDVDGTTLLLALSGEQLGAYTLRVDAHHPPDAYGMDCSRGVSKPSRFKTKTNLRNDPCNTSKGLRESGSQSGCNRRDSGDHGGHGKKGGHSFGSLEGKIAEDSFSGFGGDSEINHGGWVNSRFSVQLHGRGCDELGKCSRVNKDFDGCSSKTRRDSSDRFRATGSGSDVIFERKSGNLDFPRSSQGRGMYTEPHRSYGGELVGQYNADRFQDGSPLGGYNELNSLNRGCGPIGFNAVTEHSSHAYDDDNTCRQVTTWECESLIEDDHRSVEMEDCWFIAESETKEYSEAHYYSRERQHTLHAGRMQQQHVKYGAAETTTMSERRTTPAEEEHIHNIGNRKNFEQSGPAVGKRSNEARPDGVNFKTTSATGGTTYTLTMETGHAESATIAGETQHNTSTEGNRQQSLIEGHRPRGKRGRRNAAKKARLDETPSQRGVSKRVKTKVPRICSVSYEDMNQSKLFVAIAAKPPVALTAQQAEQLKNALEESILDAVLSPDGSAATAFAPAFRGKPFLSDGVLKMGCEDEQSLQWLKRTVNRQLIEGLSLTVIPQSEIAKMTKQVKAGLLLPTERRDIVQIHRVLCAQNPCYDINSWTLLKASVQEGKGLFLTLNLPEVEVEKLTKRSRRVAFSTGSVYVRYFIHGVLSVTPPETAATAEIAVETKTTTMARDGASAAGAAVADVMMGSRVGTEDKDILNPFISWSE